MEPHWNEAKIKQVIGRAIRYKSHNLLPENCRHVDIYRWASVFPETIGNQSADQYLMEISKRKDDIFERFKDIIIKSSINNVLTYYDYYRIYKGRYNDLSNKTNN
jgi:hypothetical protein